MRERSLRDPPLGARAANRGRSRRYARPAQSGSAANGTRERCCNVKRVTHARPLLIYADSYTDANMLHATGFLAVDPFAYLERDGQRVLLTSALEAGRAKKESRATAIRQLDEFDHQRLVREGRNADDAYAEVLRRFLAEYGARELAVPKSFPVFLADRLRADGFALEIAADLAERRRRKSAAEVRAIEEAQRATEAAFDIAVRMLREASVGAAGTLTLDRGPLTAERVRARMEAVMLESGCAADDTIAAPGTQAADPHAHGTGPYRAGEAIVLDIYPRSKSTHYFSDMSRTICRGAPLAAIVKMYEVVLRAQEEGIRMIRPGVTGRAIHERVEDVLFEAGYGTLREGQRRDGVASFIHGTGHGVGLEIHEAPSIGRAGTKPLEVGDVITIEPGLYDPAVGGVRIEDTLLVTETGARNLARSPKTLRI